MIEFKLPSLGADMDKGKLVAWKIAPGDVVRRGQIVAVIETSKAAVEVEIWQDGTVEQLLVESGTTVPVGTTLATLRETGATTADVGAVAPALTMPPPSVPATAATQAVTAAREPVPAAKAPGETAARRRISPAARKHADDAGLDITTLTGTGPDGAVTLADVEQAIAAASLSAEAKPTATPVSAAANEPSEMRKAIAAAMSRSKREIPHYYLSETVPMKNAQRWLATVNEQRPITERILMAAVQLKAVALALKEFPDMNGFYSDGRFRPGSGIHVGVAISLRQGGLVAPAIHDAADKPVEQLMRDLMDLVRRTRAGSLRGSELTDATITVTNLGEQGVEAVQGVIYPPQVALVGLGRIAERPWVESGGLFAMPLMTVTLAADHRVSDGHRGGRFLAMIRDLLQHPEKW